MMIITPNQSDILLGRGGKNNKNQGNELLRQLSRKHALKYDFSSKTKKADIIDSLLSQISASKPEVRFLLQDKSTRKWNLASKCASREKVSQALRDAARRGQNNKDRNQNSFPVEYHSGAQGLPGYYEEEDCYVIGSFKSYKGSGSNVHKNEQPNYFNPGMDFGKSLGRVSTNVTYSFYPLQPKENLNEHPPSSASMGNSTSNSVNSYSPQQLSTHTPELTSTPTPEQTSREAPPSPYSGSTISSHGDPHFVNQNHYYSTERISTHAPEQTLRLAPERNPSPYSGSTVSSHNDPHFVSQEYCYSAPQVQAPNHCHENKRKRTSSSTTFFGQDDRTETFRNVKRWRPCHEIEPVPFQQHVIVDPPKTNKKVDQPVLLTPDEIEKLELSNFDDLDNFDWGLRANV